MDLTKFVTFCYIKIKMPDVVKTEAAPPISLEPEIIVNQTREQINGLGWTGNYMQKDGLLKDQIPYFERVARTILNLPEIKNLPENQQHEIVSYIVLAAIYLNGNKLINESAFNAPLDFNRLDKNKWDKALLTMAYVFPEAQTHGWQPDGTFLNANINVQLDKPSSIGNEQLKKTRGLLPGQLDDIMRIAIDLGAQPTPDISRKMTLTTSLQATALTIKS